MREGAGKTLNCLLCVTVEEIMEHIVVDCGGLKETRERDGVGGCISLEEVLLFEEGLIEERVKRLRCWMRCGRTE